jgi:pilus assembly protein FimV
MAFNKSKALENALKFLNQGKVPLAIAEYQQILRNDAKDQATLMTVGDLYARQGDMSHAIEYFERLAQVYLNDGFNSKAIAIYKKIAKLAPNELAPLERLADLYVQQGVLSEARPLFLQIAEAHLKANHAQKAVEVLHRLLDVEPENLRVQMRLAELYNVMGQKKEAALTYLNYAQRLLDRGEQEEAVKLLERALEVDPENGTAVFLKAKLLTGAGKENEAITLLESHPEAHAGGEVTSLLLDSELKSGQIDKATERARKQLARGHQHTAALYTVADAMISSGHGMEVLPLLQELRNPSIEAGEQDKFLKVVSGTVANLPQETAPLELLIDYCRHTSNSHQLPLALSQLADLCASKGEYTRAEECLQELIDRNKNDERLVERLNQLRSQSGGTSQPVAPATPPAFVSVEEIPEEAPAAARPAIIEETFDEETQKYIAQALTDVDLFSSYGLTQKATHLLENVLQRAPRHTPTLERLLDMHLGAGNERRTAELASQLEQIHRERNDTVNADRFSELRQRFQKAAGMTADELPSAPPMSAQVAAVPVPVENLVKEPQASVAAETAAPETPVFEVAPVPLDDSPASAPAAAEFVEFEIPLIQAEPDEVAQSSTDSGATTAAATPNAPCVPEPQEVVTAPSLPAHPVEEVDLSDEWEAMIQDVAEPAAAAPVEPGPVAAESETEPAIESAREHAPELEVHHVVEPGPEIAIEPEIVAEAEPEPILEVEPYVEPEPSVDIAAPEAEVEVAQSDLDESAPAPVVESSVIELKDIFAEKTPSEPASDPVFEIIDDPSLETETEATVAGTTNEFDLELAPQSSASKAPEAATTEDFINDLVAEIDGFAAPVAEVATPAAHPRTHELEPELVAAVPIAPVAGTTNGNSATSSPVPQVSAESLNQLSEVFQEFRAELGELGEEDEDLETHYNLGIAYREMGLLDEAIGEFQKVAKAVQKGKAFRYTMNCSTMLGLCFMDKGEPKIASIWYQRALEVPGLEQDAVLALRYDLAMALENAGESKQALDSFRQVYAVNIDYRDVADRIAELQKH